MGPVGPLALPPPQRDASLPAEAMAHRACLLILRNASTPWREAGRYLRRWGRCDPGALLAQSVARSTSWAAWTSAGASSLPRSVSTLRRNAGHPSPKRLLAVSEWSARPLFGADCA